ncbi:phospholipase A-2-activating protein-like [Trichogramma pretiosum]|uniref:phospholipase A-2-activating protein-like n=1 Tax=Trichogramma pretiosum TaxID=7493 RepID=UPI0006C9A0CA|nr:phospholipase A-2-activating protein-like [Trichogramma pretiosum]
MAQAAVQPYPSHSKYKPSLEIVAEGFQRIRHVAACGAEGSFVTASDRKDLCFWKGPNYEKTRVRMLGIEGDVNSLCYLQPTSQNPLGYVVVGCSDRSLSIYVAGESKPQQSYSKVAVKEVRGLRASCHKPGLEFLCCDGDQAKLWNLTELREKRDQPSVTYEAGLEVTCCVDSPDGQRVIAGARNSQLLVFERASGKLAMVLMGHEGPLNDLAMLQGGCQEFLSCGSNDPSIRRWNFETGKMLQVYRKHNDEASVRCLALAQGGAVVASCGTDRTLRLWRGGKFAQTIAVPVEGEVWCCELLPGTGDLVCGAGDGILRLFTADPKRYAAKELVTKYDTELIGMVKEKCTKSNNEKEKQPLEELIQPGAAGGQTIIINEGSGEINSYTWCDHNNKWHRIAEVMETVDEKTPDGRTIFEGRAWDHVLPVAIGKNAPPNARVAFNDGDNLDVVARQFVRRYGLDRDKIPEVLQFIRASIGARSVLDGRSGQELFQQRGESRVVPRNNVVTGEQYLPQKQYVKMKAVQLAGIIDRILEFNRECIPTFPIDKLVCQNNSVTIEDKAKKKLVVNQIFEVASRWPAHKVYPILDLARLIVLDKETNELMYADPWKLLELLRRFLPPKSDDTAATTTGGPARMLVLRLLANSFVEECGETFFSHYFETVNSLIRDTEIGGRHVEIAAATYVLNAAVAASATDDPAGQCNAFSLAMRLMKDTRDPEARFRLLVALGTLLAEIMCEQQHENFVATLRMSEDFFGFLAEALSAPEPQKLSKVALEVKNLVYDC